MEGMRMAADPFVLAHYRRVLNGQTDQVYLFFERAVLDRYRGDEAYKLNRTDNIGTLKLSGGWTLTFGIAGELLIHVAAGELAERLPEREREHWLQHLVHLPHSRQYVRVRMVPGSCFDDGDIRSW
jgi:hypothetical protein